MPLIAGKEMALGIAADMEEEIRERPQVNEVASKVAWACDLWRLLQTVAFVAIALIPS